MLFWKAKQVESGSRVRGFLTPGLPDGAKTCSNVLVGRVGDDT